jgi:hypothetical protein
MREAKSLIKYDSSRQEKQQQQQQNSEKKSLNGNE